LFLTIYNKVIKEKMATDPTLIDLENKIKAIQALAKRLNKDISQFQFSGDFLSQADRINVIFEGLSREARALQGNFNDIKESLTASLGVLTTQSAKVSSLRSSFKSLDTILTKLVADEESWNELNKQQIQNYISRTKELKLQANLTAKTLLKDKNIIQSLQEQINLADILNDTSITFTEQEREALTLLSEQENAFEQTIRQGQKRLKTEKDTQSAMGLTGALLDNLKGIGARVFGGIGLNMAAFGDELTESRDKVKRLSKAFADGNFAAAVADGFKGGEKKFDKLSASLKEGGSAADRFRVRLATMGAGLPGIGKAVKEAFNDPLSMAVGIAGKLWQAFKAVDKEATDYQRNTGVALDRQNLLNTRLITSVDYIKQASALMTELGLRADLVFPKDMIAAGAELVNKLGLSNQEAAKLSIISQATGTNLDRNVENIVSTVNQFNRANRTALNHGQILKEVAKTSDGITASMGGSVTKITAAASAAKRLGLELKDVDTIANSLLDFESSIEAELEAQLLTGKDINLNKARELALANDLEGVGKEIFKNSTDLFEYGSYNRIQQEAYAKSLGLSRDQLAKIAYIRGIESKLTGEALEKATGLTAEELKRMEVTQSIATSIEKLAQAFAPILAMVAGIVSYLVEWKGIIGPLVTTMGTLYGISKGIALYSKITAGIEAARIASLYGAVGAQTALNAAKLVGLQRTIAQVTLASLLTPGRVLLGIAAAAAASYAISSLVSKSKQVNDGYFTADQGLVVSGPEGSYKLNKNDQLVAGTNLGIERTENSGISGFGRTEQYIQQTLQETRKLVSLMESLNNKNTNILLDGNKVSVGLALADSKNA